MVSQLSGCCVVDIVGGGVRLSKLMDPQKNGPATKIYHTPILLGVELALFNYYLLLVLFKTYNCLFCPFGTPNFDL